MEIVPTSLPELPKPYRTSGESQKPQFLNPKFYIKFPAGEAGTKIADDILFRLAITDAIIVNSLLLIPAFLISRYNLSRESLAKMQSELRLKRARDESL